MFKKYFKKLLYLGIFCLILLVVLGFYATAIEPNRLVIVEQNLNLPHWDKELNGFKVAAISDIHGGSDFIDEAKLQKVVEMTNAQNPDIIVLLGDYVSQAEGRKSKALKMPMETIAENLRGLKAKYGVYVVIGNHDWWFDEAKVRTEFEKVGFKVLDYTSADIDVNGKNVRIIGIEDFWKQKLVNPDLVNAVVNDKQNVIGLTHNPDTFEWTTDKISLMIAGHTHGGQVWLPIIGAPLHVAKKKYTYGHIVEDGRHLFVTKGIGTSGPPVRFCATPEIAILNLYAEDAN
jgi:predicted MPP superfamily phosphohydrolase